jgi:TetR/AcrR family fatty acid metabolism transcriptional regulator
MQSTTNAPRSLKEKQRQEREALILQAAEEVFLEKGYHETSIDEIAARVGIAKGTVYLHFPSKEDLLFAIVERDTRRMQEKIEANVAEAATPQAKLEAIFRTIYQSFFDQTMCIPYLIQSSTELHRLFMEKQSIKREKWERVSKLVQTLLDEGKASGVFDASIPTPIMTQAFFSPLTIHTRERLLAEQGMSSQEAVEHLRRLYFKSIASI